MPWLTEIVDRLSLRESWGYRPDEPPAAEPAALCAMALIGHDRAEAAIGPLDELCKIQAADGSVGVRRGEPAPHWSTAYSILAWRAALRNDVLPQNQTERYHTSAGAACNFLLTYAGKALDPSENPEVGHNTLLIGWPWVDGTHSWMEPTALCYLALKASYMRLHDRALNAVRLLIDRLLPEGGCNHGNTTVLGQVLRPHIEPSGLVMLALPYEAEGEPRVEKTLEYLTKTLDATTTSASLSYGLLGLTAHRHTPAGADELLAIAASRPTLDVGASGPRRPLLALAALGDKSPLVEMSREGGPT